MTVFVMHAPKQFWCYRRLGYVHSFIHSGYFYSASSSPLLFIGAPDYSIDSVSELTRRSATEWRTCPKVPYMVAGVGLKPATLRMEGAELTPHYLIHVMLPHSCYVTSFMLPNFIHVTLTHSCYVTLFVLRYLIHVTIPHSCYVTLSMLRYCIHVTLPYFC